jgi:4-hydroxy-3-polyprenylbenzoate decarboxylase
VYLPVPAFYAKPKSLDEMVHYTVARMLDLFDINTEGLNRWDGMASPARERGDHD